MSNQTLYYDTQAIRNAASDIRAKSKIYKSASDSVNTTITGLKSYWNDPVNQNFCNRYNNELKGTVEGVQNLMEAYAKFLEEAAVAIDDAVKKGNTAINR